MFDYVIITCGKQKLKTSKLVSLDKLYISRLGRGKIQLARSLTTNERIYVFSGLLGLVPLSSTSAWYDSKNKLPSFEKIKDQARQYPMTQTDKIFFIGQNPVFKMLQKIYPQLINLIPNAKGSGDFTRIIYEKIQARPECMVEKTHSRNRTLDDFLVTS